MSVKVENISSHNLPWSWGTQQFGTSGVLDMWCIAVLSC